MNEFKVVSGTIGQVGGVPFLSVPGGERLSMGTLVPLELAGRRVRITIESLRGDELAFDASPVDNQLSTAFIGLSTGFDILAQMKGIQEGEGIVLWSPGRGEHCFRFADPRELAHLPTLRDVAHIAKSLFDYYASWDVQGDTRQHWADLGAELWGEHDHRVQKLRAQPVCATVTPSPEQVPQDVAASEERIAHRVIALLRERRL